MLFQRLRLEEAKLKRHSGNIIRQKGRNLSPRVAIRHGDGLWIELGSW